MSGDVLVSARIAQGKKDAAKSILSSLGVTTSDLINSAFDYVVENKSLPGTVKQRRGTLADFTRFLESSSLPVQWGDAAPDGDYRTLIREGKLAHYESLA